MRKLLDWLAIAILITALFVLGAGVVWSLVSAIGFPAGIYIGIAFGVLMWAMSRVNDRMWR